MHESQPYQPFSFTLSPKFTNVVAKEFVIATAVYCHDSEMDLPSYYKLG